MNDQRKKEDNFIITFSDVLMICKKNKKKIVFWVLAFACMAALFALTRPIQYQAKSTFREKSKTASDSSKSISLAMLVGGGDSNETAALSTMKSRKISEQVIWKKNLQATLQRDQWNFNLFKNIRDNLKVEWALFRDIPEPVLRDPKDPIKVTDVVYDGELPVKLKIRFTSEDTYLVSDKTGNIIGNGELGGTFLGPKYSFILMRQSEKPVSSTTFRLTLDSVVRVAERQAGKFKCESDTRDKCLIKLTYKHPSRHEASDYLNTLMTLYQAYLRNEHRRISHEQIAYLNKRQDEAGSKLKSMMEEHAHSLTSNMATMDFLFQTQQSYTQKLLLIDMELRRLQKARNEGIVFYERYWIDGGDPAVINQILNDIREYRQQADSIDIALRNIAPEDPEHLKTTFTNQIAELENIRDCSREAKALFTALEEQRPLPPVIKLSTNPKYMIKDWQEKISQNEIAFNEAPFNEKSASKSYMESCKTNFNAYLANLIHLLDVEGKIVQERLTHQQGLQLEFQGIDLSTANHLYINYSKSLNDIEAEILHYEFILNQMKDPDFEPSSLSTVLEDPVSREIISRASNLLLMIQDHDNRSQKELERLRSELTQQKEFLSLHLKQTMQLLHLRKKLFREKILSLQNAQLELIQQKISVLEQHLADYIDSRIVNMKQERNAIEQQQEALKLEMEKMPEKWSSEKLIEQHLEMSRKMVEEITKMVESKNISAHLDISQSSPMDHAVPPLHPIRSHFLVFGLLGGVLGFFLSVGFILGKVIVKGIPATQNNLQFSGQRVVGALSKSYGSFSNESLRNEDLDTLRRLYAQLGLGLDAASGGQSVLLMLGKGVDYSHPLAELISKSGCKVLVMRISFDTAALLQQLPGLLQYLEGTSNSPKCIKKESYDFIAAGGISRFSHELIHSSRFAVLLDKLKKEYDWILVVSTTSPVSGEGEGLVHLFDEAALTIANEKLEELKPYFAMKHVSYIF